MRGPNILITRDGWMHLRNFDTKRERSRDEVFPWDFIDTGVTKEFLKREWQNAMEENVTPNCRMRCSGCGAAQFKTGVCMAER